MATSWQAESRPSERAAPSDERARTHPFRKPQQWNSGEGRGGSLWRCPSMASGTLGGNLRAGRAPALQEGYTVGRTRTHTPRSPSRNSRTVGRRSRRGHVPSTAVRGREGGNLPPRSVPALREGSTVREAHTHTPRSPNRNSGTVGTNKLLGGEIEERERSVSTSYSRRLEVGDGA